MEIEGVEVGIEIGTVEPRIYPFIGYALHRGIEQIIERENRMRQAIDHESEGGMAVTIPEVDEGFHESKRVLWRIIQALEAETEGRSLVFVLRSTTATR